MGWAGGQSLITRFVRIMHRATRHPRLDATRRSWRPRLLPGAVEGRTERAGPSAETGGGGVGVGGRTGRSSVTSQPRYSATVIIWLMIHSISCTRTFTSTSNALHCTRRILHCSRHMHSICM